MFREKWIPRLSLLVRVEMYLSDAYRRALSLTTNGMEQDYLARRLAETSKEPAKA